MTATAAGEGNGAQPRWSMAFWRRRLDPTTGGLPVASWHLAAYTVAAVTGRLVRTDVSGLGVAWPSVAVAVVWLYPYLQRRAWWRRPDLWLVLAAMAVSTAVVNRATGLAVPAMVWTAPFTNPIAGVIAGSVYLAGRDPWEAGLRNGHEVRRLALACFVGIAGGWLPTYTAGAVTGQMTFVGSLFWALRNGVELLYGAAAAVLLHGRPPRVPLDRAGWPRVLTATAIVSLGLTGLSSSDYAPALGYAWIGLAVGSAAYFSLVEVHVYLTVIGTLLTGLAAVGRSPLVSNLTQNDEQASLVYSIMFLLLVAAMALAADRQARVGLIEEVRVQEEAARRQAEVVTAIVSSMTEGVLLLGADETVRLHNTSALRLLDSTASSAPASGPAPDPAPIAAAARASLRSGPTDAVLPAPAGGPARTVAVQASPLGPGVGSDVAVVLRDVTDDRRRLDELRTFARVLAHDLRQPLTSVLLWSELLEQEVGEHGEQAEAARQVRHDAVRMEAFLAAITAYSAARDGRLQPEAVRLGDLAREVAMEVAGAVTQDAARDETGGTTGGVRLGRVPTITVRAPHVAVVDRSLLRQLLTHLIGNAVTYVVPGTAAHVDVHTAAHPGWVVLTVDDAGLGIPEDERLAVFEEFHRMPAHREAFEGTGLGLAICRRIVERHGGHLAAGGSPLGGARIEVRLPA